MIPRRPAPVLAVAAAGLLAACATNPPPRPVAEEELRAEIRARGLNPDRMVYPGRLTPKMKEWLEAKARESSSPFETLRNLIYQLQHPKDLALTYEPGYTGTAQEVFETGSFNCLSFTQLFVSMARELGIEAYYVKVDDIERYKRIGDLVVRSGHVTAAYSTGPEERVIEFDVGPEADYRYTEPISDLTAIALYYANRGGETLREGNVSRAMRWLEVAVQLAPGLADTWINLGVTRRRAGDLDGAEAAYEKALEVDPDAFAAYHNLTQLYAMRGEDDAAKSMLRLLDRRANRNPFIYLALGDDSMEEERYADAEHFYRKALAFSDEQAEARAALGLWALAEGDLMVARRWLERARREDAGNPRVTRLAEELRRAEGIE